MAKPKRKPPPRPMVEPIDWQERHSPTEAVNVTVRHDGLRRVTVERCRRRILDARLWNSFSGPQQDAAELIETGFRLVTAGIGVRMQAFDRRIPGIPSSSEWQAAVASDYWLWAKTCVRQRIDHAGIILVLIEGESLATVDRARRQRKGAAREALVDGLNLYCKMRGWPQERNAA